MASRSDREEEAMTSEGEGEGWRMEVGETSHGRLSLILCHQCQSLHYQLQCHSSSSLGRSIAGGDRGSYRNSVTWDEFFGKGVTGRCRVFSFLSVLSVSVHDNHSVHARVQDSHSVCAV